MAKRRPIVMVSSSVYGQEELLGKILMEQRTKAESDIAVAAASILARDRFVSCVAELEQETGFTLPKGAGPGVKAVAAEILKKSGAEGLRRCCKNHFKTFEEVLNGD